MGFHEVPLLHVEVEDPEGESQSGMTGSLVPGQSYFGEIPLSILPGAIHFRTLSYPYVYLGLLCIKIMQGNNIIGVMLRPHRLRRHYTSVNEFWPSGPPPFHKDSSIKSEADRLYSATLRNYYALGRRPREQWGDPWAKREDWRYHPYFGPANVIKHAFPGFGWAVAAFIAYLGYERWFM